MSKGFKIFIIISLIIGLFLILAILGIRLGRSYLINTDFTPVVHQAAVAEIISTSTPAEIPLPEYSKPEPSASLIAVGDIMLSRSVEQEMIVKKDFAWPFTLLADFTKSADITFGNLETAIISGREILPGEFAFRTDPKAVTGLQTGGFDIVSLANNHAGNFGQAGFASTFAELNKAKIKYVGADASAPEIGRPVIIERNGLKFGFLAYTYGFPSAEFMLSSAKIAGVNYSDVAKIKSDVGELKQQADFVIVSLHDGTEYIFTPNKEQEEFARAAIDAGASLVIGHHPHVVQTAEKYKNGYIFYSLGNFIFDQLWSVPTQQGLAVKINFSKKEIKDIELVPVKINKYFQATAAAGKDAETVISRLKVPVEKSVKFFRDGKNYVEMPAWLLGNIKTAENFQTYQAADLDGDGRPEEAVVVDKIGYLIKDGKAVWRTDAGWRVDNVLIGDFNNDKIVEVGFSLWKEGSFGPSKPFWVEENDKNISNHLFLYQYDLNPSSTPPLRMVWGSSALDDPIKEMALGDFNYDGKNELVVIEDVSNPEGAVTSPHLRILSIWHFSGFNFFNDFKSRVGSYRDLEIFGGEIFLDKGRLAAPE